MTDEYKSLSEMLLFEIGVNPHVEHWVGTRVEEELKTEFEDWLWLFERNSSFR